MPTVQQTANTSGLSLWTEALHRKVQLVGLQIDNRSLYNEMIQVYDCFLTTSGRLVSGGAAGSQEDFDTYTASGKIKLQVSVPAGEVMSLGEEDLKEAEFLGDGRVVGDTTTSDCVIVARYRHK